VATLPLDRQTRRPSTTGVSRNSWDLGSIYVHLKASSSFVLLGLNHSGGVALVLNSSGRPARVTRRLQGARASRRPARACSAWPLCCCALGCPSLHWASPEIPLGVPGAPPDAANAGRQIASYATWERVRAAGAGWVPCCRAESRCSRPEPRDLFPVLTLLRRRHSDGSRGAAVVSCALRSAAFPAVSLAASRSPAEKGSGCCDAAPRVSHLRSGARGVGRPRGGAG